MASKPKRNDKGPALAVVPQAEPSKLFRVGRPLPVRRSEGFTQAQTRCLEGDLDLSHVKKREGKFSYIEGWHAIAEANRIFGFDAWDSSTETTIVCEYERSIGQGGTKGWGVTYNAKVRIVVTAHGRTISREGVGTGHGIDRDRGKAHESAIKEAETDARKRALMTFGNKFGLALYDKDQRNVSRGADEADDLSLDQPQQQEPSAQQGRVSAPATTSPPLSQSAQQAAVAPERSAPAKAADPISPEAEVEKALQKMASDRAAAEAKKNMQAPLEGDAVKKPINPTTSKEILIAVCVDLVTCTDAVKLAAWAQKNKDDGIRERLTDEDNKELSNSYREHAAQLKAIQLAKMAEEGRDPDIEDELRKGDREPGDDRDELER